MRIAAMAIAQKLTVNPHTSATAVNVATTIQFLCAVDNPGYLEGRVTLLNPFRAQLCDKARTSWTTRAASDRMTARASG